MSARRSLFEISKVASIRAQECHIFLLHRRDYSYKDELMPLSAHGNSKKIIGGNLECSNASTKLRANKVLGLPMVGTPHSCLIEPE